MVKFASESKLLARHTAVYALGGILQKFTAFFLLPLYTRYLTPRDYGIQEMVGLSADVAGTLIATAIATSVFRFYFEFDDARRRNEVLSTAIIALGGTGCLVLASLIFLARPLAFHLLDDPGLAYYFWVAFTTLFFQSINNIYFSYLRAHQQSTRFIVVSLMAMVLSVGLNVYLIVERGMGVFGILVSSLSVSIITFLFFTAPMLKRIGLKFSREIFRGMLHFGLPLIPSHIGRIIVNLSDRYFIKAFLSLADAGIYSLGYRFGVLPSIMVSQPFNLVWMPRRLEIFRSPDAEYIFGRIFTYFLGLMFFVGLAVAVLSKEVIMLMADPQYWQAYNVVPVLVLANIIFTLPYHFQIGFIVQKKTGYMGAIDASNAALVLLLNYLLIPRLGMMGAAYATLIAFTYKAAMTYYFSNRMYPVYFETWRVLKIVVAAGLLFFACTFVVDVDILAALLIKLGIVLCFPALLFVFRFYRPGEVREARRTISVVRGWIA